MHFRCYRHYCYGPNIISVTVTKGGHLSGGGLYRTSKTMGRGVAKSRKSLIRENVEMWEYTQRTNILTY